MSENNPILEPDLDSQTQDPDEIPIKNRKLYTQPYDLAVESLVNQIKSHIIFLRPLSIRPKFQRRYVWSDVLASRLIESILLNVPIPPCYLSQNEEFEIDVIDGQQRLYSIYRFIDNQFKLTGLEVLTELNKLRFHEIPPKLQRQFKTHTLRCILITNESHPEIKFDVFQRLNTNTAPLNSQELRNCVNRGKLIDLLQEAASYSPWLTILGRKEPDNRMRDEELILRFYAFQIKGIESYRTPQKHWLNDAAEEGKNFSDVKIKELYDKWTNSIDICLRWFEPNECFRRLGSGRSRTINKSLFDLILYNASNITINQASASKEKIRTVYNDLLTTNLEFRDLISRAIDHTKRTKRRFEIWEEATSGIFS